MLNAFAKKASALPDVRAIIVRTDQVTVVLDKAPAKTYIRITSLIDGINKKLFFGKPVTASIREDLSESEFHSLIRTPGVVYARDEEPRIPPSPRS